MDKVRVLRVLEYVGDREFIEQCLKGSIVPNNGELVIRRSKYGDYDNVIKAAIIGTFPEIMEREHVIQDAMPPDRDASGTLFCPTCKGSLWQNKDECKYCFRCGQKIKL